MFGILKMLFKNKDQIAQGVWSMIGSPINLARTTGSYKDFANEFATSLQRADDLVLLDIYPAREKPIIGVNSKMLLDLCNNPKKEVCSKDELLSVLENKNIDVLLTLGAGDIGTLVQPIKHMLN